MKNSALFLLILMSCLLLPASLKGQESAASVAQPQDVKSLDNIIATLYAVISGEKGVARDWERFLYLFKPGAQLIPSGINPEKSIGLSYMSPQQYVETSGPWLEQNGFFEQEIAREELHFGSMTHVWSTYESRRQASDPKPFVRGINSIQLINDGDRWWIVNIYWTAEREGLVIPEEFLPH